MKVTITALAMYMLILMVIGACMPVGEKIKHELLFKGVVMLCCVIIANNTVRRD